MNDLVNTQIDCGCGETAIAKAPQIETQEANCGCGGDSCQTESQEANAPIARKQLEIEFLYLDLTQCNRCQGTESNLEDAIADVASVLQATGVDVTVQKIHVQSKAQAIAHQFVSSPTIRINDRDIQLDVRENQCNACGDLCGESVDCRIWVYQGEEYPSPPKAMIIDAVLQAVYSKPNGSAAQEAVAYVVPENLKRFFQGMGM